MPWDPQAEYLAGLRGVYADPAASERLTQLTLAQGQAPDAGTTCRRYGLVGSGAGKLSAPFAAIQHVFGNALPASAQDRGDCVAHSTRNAVLGTLACEIAAGQPDEVSGRIEGVPTVSPQARQDGVLATESTYWWRGHGGDGWSCDHAAEVVMTKAGMWLRIGPVRTGVDRMRSLISSINWNRPRAYGGGPNKAKLFNGLLSSAPCVRGWTVTADKER
jgi:hypothetical protein